MIPPSRNLICIDGGVGGMLGGSPEAAIDSVLVNRRASDGCAGGGATVATEATKPLILAAVRGETALRSMKMISSDVLRSLRATAADLLASATRFAVAIASLGGTMLRMMSTCVSNSSSVLTSIIFAARILSTVC